MLKNVYNLLSRVYKLIYNISIDFTYGHFLGGNIKSKFKNAGAYDTVNSSYFLLPKLFANTTITEKDVIVDIGCGKGRVINWLLAQGKRNKIIGIELDPDIAEETKKRLRQHKNVEIIHGNVLDCLPSNGTLFYLYNPFNADILKKFINCLLNQHHLLNTEITIIYHNCQHLNIFQKDSRFIINEIDIPSDTHSSALIKLSPQNKF